MTDICSIWAYHEILESGKLARLHGMYLAVFSEAGKPLTIHQAVTAFKEKFKEVPYRSDCGLGSRITELTAMGFLRKYDQIKCDSTKKMVNRWLYTGRKEPLDKMKIKITCPHCHGRGEVDHDVYISNSEDQMKFL